MITPAYAPTATERVLPRLALDFTTGVLDSRVTVTRALNTATAVNSSGFIAVVNANLPRFDYDPATLASKGLLIEESRTNSLLYSEQFSESIWAGGLPSPCPVSPNVAISPSGLQNADEITVASGTPILRQITVATVGTSYTHSVYVKAAPSGSATHFRLTSNNTAAWNTGASSKVALTNSWQRVTITWTQVSTTNIYTILGAFDVAGNADPDCYGKVLIWGGQGEPGAFATSYIPTTTTSVTRNADVVSMTGTNFSNWYSAGAGAFQISTIPRATSGARPLIQADDNTANNIIALRQNVADPELYIISGGVLQAQIDAGTASANTAYKLAGTWATNNCAAAQNGGVAATDLSATIPAPTQLRIGSDGTNYGNVWIAKINYWPQRITNSEVSGFSK